MTGLVNTRGEATALRRFPQHFATDVKRAQLPTGGPEVWGDRCCGLACLRTVLDFHGLPVPDQAVLLRQGLERGAYSDRGWIHAGLVELAREHGLAGIAGLVSGLADLLELVDAGVPPIVSCAFQLPQDGRRGGHLVVLGRAFVHDSRRLVSFADPSRWGARNDAVPDDRFWASCTGNVIALWPAGTVPLPASLARRSIG